MKKIYYVTQDTTGRNIELTGLPFTNVNQDNIIGIINLDQQDPLYTPMDQANIVNMSYAAGVLDITLSDTVPSITAGEKLMIKLYFDDDGKASSGDVTDARDKVMGGTGYGTGKTGRSVKEVYDQIGTKDSSDGTEPTSLFGWFRRLWSQMVVGSTTYARESSVNHNSTTVITVAEDVQTKVGAKDNTDSEEPATLFSWFRKTYQNILSVYSNVYDAQNTKSAVSEAASANTKIGTNADNASDSFGSGTIFGKLRAIIDLLKNGSYGLSEIESEVANAGTAAGTAANKAESADDKLGDKGDSADDTTTGSVFARLRAIINKIGTNSDAAVEISGSGTIFGRLRAIIDNYLDNSSYGLSKIYTDMVKQSNVGTSSDTAAENGSTLFAVLKWVKDKLGTPASGHTVAGDAGDAATDAEAIKTAVGDKSNSAGEASTDTMFSWVKKLRDYLNGIVNTAPYAKESSVKTNVGGTDYTAIGELRDNNHGLSALLAKLAQIIAYLGTIQIETQILSLPNAARIDIVTPEQSSGAISNLQIHANVMYHLGDLTALSLIMVEPSDLTIYNEFVVCFFCQTGFTLQITHWDANTQVLFNSGATCEAGHYYILSVVDNLALLAKF